jgi:hypothetical protein
MGPKHARDLRFDETSPCVAIRQHHLTAGIGTIQGENGFCLDDGQESPTLRRWLWLVRERRAVRRRRPRSRRSRKARPQRSSVPVAPRTTRSPVQMRRCSMRDSWVFSWFGRLPAARENDRTATATRQPGEKRNFAWDFPVRRNYLRDVGAASQTTNSFPTERPRERCEIQLRTHSHRLQRCL